MHHLDAHLFRPPAPAPKGMNCRLSRLSKGLATYWLHSCCTPQWIDHNRDAGCGPLPLHLRLPLHLWFLLAQLMWREREKYMRGVFFTHVAKTSRMIFSLSLPLPVSRSLFECFCWFILIFYCRNFYSLCFPLLLSQCVGLSLSCVPVPISRTPFFLSLLFYPWLVCLSPLSSFNCNFSLSISLSFSLSLSKSLSFSLSLSLFLSLCYSFSLSAYVSVSLSLSLCVSSVSLPFTISIYLWLQSLFLLLVLCLTLSLSTLHSVSLQLT